MTHLGKTNLKILICFCLLSIAAFAHNNSNGLSKADKAKVAIQKEILDLEEIGREKALKGESNWDDLISEGAFMIAFDGKIITYQKGQNIPSLPLKVFNLSEMIVRVFDKETAVVTGLAEVTSETAEKKPFSFQMRFLNVWRKSTEGWKIAVSERTGVKQATK
jgi:hypothetical protein